MQPADLRLAPPKLPPPARFADEAPTSDFDPTPTASAAAAPLRLAAPALLVEARFRGTALASRLLRADDGRAFVIGNARGCDAPVNPAWLPESDPPAAPRRHVFLEPAAGGFVVNLTAAMRPSLEAPGQALALAPDAGRAEAPLALPPGSRLHVPCGEVTFDVHPAEPAATLPRPWLPPGWRVGARYLLAVALLLGLVLLLAYLLPADPRALSLDMLGAEARLTPVVVVPLQITAPTIDRARDLQATGGGGGAPAARHPAGRAGDRTARATDHRLAIQGTARPEDARALSARIHKNSLLALLEGPRTSALSAVLEDGPAMGADAQTVLGTLVAANPGAAWGAGALGALGSGAGGGGEGEGTLGGGDPLGTIGRFGRGPGSGPGYGGPGVGELHARRAVAPDPIPGIASVRGTLDKEIIRRVVCRHLNEVKYCYQQSLVRRPTLEGRLVTQFTIAPTGRVLAAVVGSSTLKEIAVESCVVEAIKRWQFPTPERGGLAMVSYPFSFAPTGD